MRNDDAAPEVSLVVPVHNGAAWIGRLIDSLRRQTFGSFQVILVDDASTDDSVEVINRHVGHDPRFVVLTCTTNLGNAPRAVNVALPHVTGERFLYASQDDHFSPDWLARMVDRATETGADAVVPDLVFDGGPDRPALTGWYGDHTAVVSGREAVVASLRWDIPGCALWRTSTVRRIGYADFAYDADEYTVRRLFHEADRVAFSGGTYHYHQGNQGAITKQRHPRQVGATRTYLRLAELLHDGGYPDDLVEEQTYLAARNLVVTVGALRRAGVPLDRAGREEVRWALRRLQHAPQPDRLRRHRRRTGDGRLVAALTTHGHAAFEVGSRTLDVWSRARRALRARSRRGDADPPSPH